MPTLTGYANATTPGNLGLGAGLVEIFTTVWEKVGATRGAPTWTPGEEWRQPEVDGLSAPVAGLDRRVYTEGVIEFTLIELSATRLAQLIPGSTSVTATGTTTITPPAAGSYITAASLYQWRVSWQKGNNTELFTVVFPKAFPSIGTVGAADRAEAGVPVTIRSRLDLSGANTVDTAPYTVLIRPV